jgi:SNF2 family DNA or RNA helicase
MRVICVPDVVKALDVAAERLGSVQRSCATLRAWAADGRVTPAGQLLTLEAVNAGIDLWLAQKEKPASSSASGSTSPRASSVLQARQPATPQASAKTRRVSMGAVAPSSQAPPPVAAVATTAPASSSAQLAAQLATQQGAATKRARKTYEESKTERLHTEAMLQELTLQRFAEVLTEIDAHIEEILTQTGPAALKAWRAAKPQDDNARRELCTRLVHTVQPDVQVPEELHAELLPHQLDGLDWLASLYVNGLHGILADEMGLGKTIQTITLMLYVKERQNNNGPHLVVAPKSTLSNWESELKRFAPSLTVHVLAVGGEDCRRENCLRAFRRDVDKGQAAVLVTNYEQVYRNEQIMNTGWQFVVVDEGHKLKNPDTVLHKHMAQLKCRMRLLLTGTPLQNSLTELWALLHYLLPDLFTCMMDFRAWFAKPFKGIEGLNEYEVKMNPEQEQQVIARMHALLSPFLLQRLKADVLADSLPPRVEHSVRAPMSAWQRAVYSDLERRTIKMFGEGGVNLTSEQVNNALMQLRKIALHPYLFQENYPKDENLIRASGKVEVLDRILPKLIRFRHKVLIFSQFTSMLDILQDFLALRKITFVRLDGQVPHDQRRERIHRFNTDAKVSVFLLSSRAGGLGLNLQAADTVILYDLDWNPQNDRQAIARAHRVGQSNEVRVMRLLTNSRVEEHIVKRCEEKLELERKIMGAGMFRKKATSDERRQALLAALGGQGGDPGTSGSGSREASGHAEEAEPTTPEELNRAMARNAEELTAFEAVDEKLLKPRKGVGADGSLLERCGRLMRPEEVPAGFSTCR